MRTGNLGWRRARAARLPGHSPERYVLRRPQRPPGGGRQRAADKSRAPAVAAVRRTDDAVGEVGEAWWRLSGARARAHARRLRSCVTLPRSVRPT